MARRKKVGVGKRKSLLRFNADTAADSPRLESAFDAAFASQLALKEKQIQQSYRPIIGIHKWFARRPGTIFRCLLLSEFGGSEPIRTSYWRAHEFRGVIADPFMGGGTPVYEANRLGFHVVGTDINPMAFWIVRQALSTLDVADFEREASAVVDEIESEIGSLYKTRCLKCAGEAEVKYFLWVKTGTCPTCSTETDLFPGYLLAESERHPLNVLACGSCGHLNEFAVLPTIENPEACTHCGGRVQIEGPARRQAVKCKSCSERFSYGKAPTNGPPTHRMWAIEYHCLACKPSHEGRFFKAPDAADLSQVAQACARLTDTPRLPIPDDRIPRGDETDRLHRWGYARYRDLFNERQLLGLGLLLRRIKAVADGPNRHALLTIFSDFLRYQNMLCRYDTYALKCQDIFSVHGFPVGLVQCENNLLGIPGVGSGAFRHFVRKYVRAKRYCQIPFETATQGRRRTVVPVSGETINARLVKRFPRGPVREALLSAAPATDVPLPRRSLDGVFTDPPYFNNVQYAELMDFCFVWLRLGLRNEFPEFRQETTRAERELTGNVTLGRGLTNFTEGLSAIFGHYAAALKPDAPFVFTYHHNDPAAYVPLVVAILDSGLSCTATLPAAAEMGASLHIARTDSSVFDSVFVCRSRARKSSEGVPHDLAGSLGADIQAITEAGIRPTNGDLRCLAAGHLARFAVEVLRPNWRKRSSIPSRMATASKALTSLSSQRDLDSLIRDLLSQSPPTRQSEAEQTGWLPGFAVEA